MLAGCALLTPPCMIVGRQDALREKATVFMGVAKDATRSPEDVISTPLPGETLAMFYARSRESSQPSAGPRTDG